MLVLGKCGGAAPCTARGERRPIVFSAPSGNARQLAEARGTSAAPEECKEADAWTPSSGGASRLRARAGRDGDVETPEASETRTRRRIRARGARMRSPRSGRRGFEGTFARRVDRHSYRMDKIRE